MEIESKLVFKIFCPNCQINSFFRVAPSSKVSLFRQQLEFGCNGRCGKLYPLSSAKEATQEEYDESRKNN